MDIACPQCGNPNLDVDQQNSVVYCKKCGFAVQVDPQTGNVTPLSQSGGSAPAVTGGGAEPSAPVAYANPEAGFFGMDKLTFFMAGLALILFATFVFNVDLTYSFIGAILLMLVYFKK